MGWGEARVPAAGVSGRLVARSTLVWAVRRFLAEPTTGNQERLQVALDCFDELDREAA